MNTVAIIAPGVNVDFEQVKAVHDARMPTIVIGDLYKQVPWAIAMYASDHPWWQYQMDNFRPELDRFNGEKFTQEATTVGKFGVALDLKWLEHVPEAESGNRLPADENKCCGTSSGMHILCYAAHRYERIVLLGYEYGAAGEGHYFGGHPQDVARPSHWPTMIRTMAPLAASIAEKGVSVVNATVPTALHCFEQASLQDELELFKRGTSRTRRAARQEAAE